MNMIKQVLRKRAVQERREAQRVAVALDVTLNNMDGSRPRLRTRDVSFNGAFIESSWHRMLSRETLQLCIAIPDDGCITLCRFRACVVRATPQGAGVAFEWGDVHSDTALLAWILSNQHPAGRLPRAVDTV